MIVNNEIYIIVNMYLYKVHHELQTNLACGRIFMWLCFLLFLFEK